MRIPLIPSSRLLSLVWPRRIAAVVLVALASTVLTGVPAQAAAATDLELTEVATVVTANRDIDQIRVEAEDGNNAVDTLYSGTVLFTASCDTGGNPCFQVSAGNAPFTPLAGNQYTFQPFVDNGSKAFYVRWEEDAVGTGRSLTVTGPLSGGGDGSDTTSGISVASNAPTRLDLSGVETQATVGVVDGFNVQVRNEAGQDLPNAYTGTVTFSASCGDCFTVTPNNGGAETKQYTYVSGDTSTKNFSLTWTTAGDNRTFTATDNALATTKSESLSGIDVEAAAATTTTSTTSSTTTTSTTLVPRVTAAQIVTGAGPGGGPHVLVRNAANPAQVLYSFFAYGETFTGGVRVATGDVNGDNYDDIITAAGPGGGPHVLVFSGKDRTLLQSFYAYGANFTGGVFVAAGDVNNDGKDDIITAPDAGGGPHVRVFSGANGAELLGFMAYGTVFTGGVRVASADFNDDGKSDVVTAPGAGGGPHVRVFSGASGGELGGFMAYGANFTGGVYVAADFSDSGAVVFTGAGVGGGRHVRALRLNGTEALGFIAGDGTNGAIPAVGEAGSKANDFFVVSRAQNNPGVQRRSFDDGTELPGGGYPFNAYAAGVGVFIAVGVL